MILIWLLSTIAYAGPSFDDVTVENLLSNRVTYSDSSSKLQSSSVTKDEIESFQVQIDGKQSTGNYITALTGDVAASGPGSSVATLSTVNSNVGSFINSNITVDAKGRITAASSGSSGGVSSVSNSDGTLTISPTTGNVIASRSAITGDVSIPAGSSFATLATVNPNVSTYGSASESSVFTVNGKGLITAAADLSILIAESQVTNLTSDLASKVPSTRTINTTSPLTGGGDLSADRTISIPQSSSTANGYLSSTDWITFNAKQSSGNFISTLTGDATATGPGSVPLTLATVNSNVGTFNTLTVNGKGLVTAASNTAYEVPLTFSTGLTRTVNTITVNPTQSIGRLSNLTTNGFVKTTGSNGTLSIDTTPYASTGSLGNYVLKAGDTMTGQLVLPSWQIPGFVGNLIGYYDNAFGLFKIDSTIETFQIINSNVGSNITLDSGGQISLAGPNGNLLIIDTNGYVNLASKNLQSINISSDFGQDIHFGNSGDYSIYNDAFGFPLMFQLLGTGEVKLNSANNNDITLTSDRDTYFLTNNSGNIYTSQEIHLQDSAIPSTDQAVIKVKTDSNFSMGLNNFTSIGGAALRDISLGVDSMKNAQNGTDNIAIGYQSMLGLSGSVDGSRNAGIGALTLANLSSGSDNFAAGDSALYSLTQGSSNSAFSSAALYFLTTGSGNYAAGPQAGYHTVDGNSNTYLGAGSGYSNVNSSSNVYIGEAAGSQMLGPANIGIGNGACVGATGANGQFNIVLGGNSLGAATSASFNTIISANTIGLTGITSANRTIIIGADADVPSATANGQMSIGNFIYGSGMTGTGSSVAGSIGIGIRSPTARLHLVQGSTGASRAPLKFTAGSILLTPEVGSMEYLGNNFYLTKNTAIQESIPGVLFTQTADKTVSNTVTETSIIGTGVGSITLPANFFVAGKTIRIKVNGVYSTPALATPSVTIKIKYGSTAVASVTTSSLLSGASNLEFDGNVLITGRTTGSSGTVMTGGDIRYATGVAGTSATDPLNNSGSTTTINTTTSNALDVTVTWDSATSTRSAKSIVSSFEVLN